MIRKNDIELLRNPNAQSKSLSAHSGNHPFAAIHMLFLPPHDNVVKSYAILLKGDENFVCLLLRFCKMIYK